MLTESTKERLIATITATVNRFGHEQIIKDINGILENLSDPNDLGRPPDAAADSQNLAENMNEARQIVKGILGLV